LFVEVYASTRFEFNYLVSPTIKMESVVVAVASRPTTLSSDDKNDESGEIAPEITEKKSSRKRRYSSEDRAAERETSYHGGSRYWGGNVEPQENRRKEFDYRSARQKKEDSRQQDKKSLDKEDGNDNKVTETRKQKEVDPILMKTGGAYIPPAKLRMMQASISDKSSLAYQRLSWEALKKSLHGLINKINISNIALIIPSLIKENIVRGRGLLARSIIQAQAASPTFTHVYATLVSIINSKVISTNILSGSR